MSAPPVPTGVHRFRRRSPRARPRPLSALVTVATLGVLAGACGSATASPSGGTGASGRASGPALSSVSSSDYRAGPGAGGPTTPAGTAAARAASSAYRVDIGNDAAGFVADVGQLHADLVAGNGTAARSDELAAQSAYDGLRLLESGNTVIASTLDERSTDIGPGQTLGGLHAVERDLWGTPPGGGAGSAPGPGLTEALADFSGLVAQAPVAQYLLSRDSLDPEAVGTTAVNELGWVDDVAVPGDEELFSRLDTVDIAATVAAARVAFAALEPLARLASPTLTTAVASSFTTLEQDVTALGPPDQTPDGSIPASTLRSVAQQVDGTAALLARLSARLAPYGTSGATS